jgi:hypothetical protein
MEERTRLLVTVDTEEDQWGPEVKGQPSVENIRALPRLHRLLRELGVRPTYFVSFQVATNPSSASLLRELAGDDGVELGAHLHPWNTPPYGLAIRGRDSMLKNLSVSAQAPMLAVLTDAVAELSQALPNSFRAGRLGLGPTTAEALVAARYRIDSSVAPYLDLSSLDDGPNYIGASVSPYRIGAGSDVRVADPCGALLEIPLSVGFNRHPFRQGQRVLGGLDSLGPLGRPIKGLLARSGLLRKILLSPEFDGPEDMLRLARSLIQERVPHLNLFLHSSSLVPGLTPFARTSRDVDRLLRSIRVVVEGLRDTVAPVFVTVSQFGSELSAPSVP